MQKSSIIDVWQDSKYVSIRKGLSYIRQNQNSEVFKKGFLVDKKSLKILAFNWAAVLNLKKQFSYGALFSSPLANIDSEGLIKTFNYAATACAATLRQNMWNLF